MTKTKQKPLTTVGLPPGSLVYTGTRKQSPAEIEIIQYNRDTCERFRLKEADGLGKYVKKGKINYLIINNLTDIKLIETVGNFFGIQPMFLEDALNTSQPPKLEETNEQMLFTIKLLRVASGGEFIMEHISIILGEYFIIVFMEYDNDIFNDLNKRIVNHTTKAREKDKDYLFYLLIDVLIDSYFPVMNELDNIVDDLEKQLLETPEDDFIRDLYSAKKKLGEIRPVLYPVNEALQNLVQGDYPLIDDQTIPFLRDLADHIRQIIQMYESNRETLNGLIELNNSNINNRLNKSMKILTLITTFFIPMTLITGIYGMNFKFMPELSWKFGYPMVWLSLILVGVIMYIIIKRNRLL